MNMQGKTVVLTGATGGIGRAIAHKMASQGASLVLVSRHLDRLEALSAEMQGQGHRELALDLATDAGRQQLVDECGGQVDILINNAGMELVSSYSALAPDHIEKMIQTNLIAGMLLARLALPHMLTQGAGHIVNMSSLGGKRGNPYGGTYAATKAGMIEWTKSLRLELKDSGVRVSVICPGFVYESGMFAAYNKKPPWISNATTPRKVAEAVIKSIKKDIAEIIVNPGPTWLIPLFDAIHPAIGNWLYKVGGVYEFYRKQAEENESKLKQS